MVDWAEFAMHQQTSIWKQLKQLTITIIAPVLITRQWALLVIPIRLDGCWMQDTLFSKLNCPLTPTGDCGAAVSKSLIRAMAFIPDKLLVLGPILHLLTRINYQLLMLPAFPRPNSSYLWDVFPLLICFIGWLWPGKGFKEASTINHEWQWIIPLL